MKLKQTLRWQLCDMRAPLLIFYAIFFAVLFMNFTGVLSVKLNIDLPGEFHGSVVGIELCSLIFLFIVGICYLGESLPLLMQNGVSRRTVFLGTILSQTVIALGMACLDRALAYLLYRVLTLIDAPVGAISLFDLLYGPPLLSYDPTYFTLRTLIPGIGFYFSFLAIGMLIWCIYARLHKRGRIAISIAVPVILIYGLAILDKYIIPGAVLNALRHFVDWSVTLGVELPFAALGLELALTVVLWGGSWLLLRRMPLKK